MYKKVFTSSLLIFLLLSSGPFYLPLAYTINNFTSSNSLLNSTITNDPSYNQTFYQNQTFYHNQTIPQVEDVEPSPPAVEAHASPSSGNSPLFVKFTGIARPLPGGIAVLAYKWDFDGDGAYEYASLDSGNTTHVYEVEEPRSLQARFTVVYRDGRKVMEKIPISVEPVDDENWDEIRSSGTTRVALHRNGTIYVYDESDWISLKFSRAGKTVSSPTFRALDAGASRLTYVQGDRLLDVTLHYGISGRVRFNFTEYLPSGMPVDRYNREILLPKNVQKGRIGFKLESEIPPVKRDVTWSPSSVTDSKEVSNPIFWPHSSTIVLVSYPLVLPSSFLQVSEGGGPIWGEGGEHNPWQDQGLTPYGEYFNNLNEYVATQTGFLTVTQTDLYLPGRGLDLAIKRIHAPPSVFEDGEPATADDYSYVNYPYAPLGNGWHLGFPWIEKRGGSPEYIHLSNGQRYLWNGSSQDGKEYHSGDHFTLYNYTNGNLTLCTVDGVRYSFDSSYRLIHIWDQCDNNITFTYDQNDKITVITDTVGRNVAFSYNENGYVANITSGSRVVRYGYDSGKVSGYRLKEVMDPVNRSTIYEYKDDYLIQKIGYPSGGHSAYSYEHYYIAGHYEDIHYTTTYDRYRVSMQAFCDGYSHQQMKKTYVYTADFHSVDDVKIKEWSDGTPQEKTTKISYSSASNYVEEVWDGTTSGTKVHRTNRTVDTGDRRRTIIEKTPGDSSTDITSVMRHDDWGNMVYSRDFEDHETYLSYENTETTGMFVDSYGEQKYGFLDAFYDNSVEPYIHNLLIGRAEYQKGSSGTTVESYYKYNSQALLSESKESISYDWARTKYFYDQYSNCIKTVDPNNHTSFYEYNSTYKGAYLTSSKRLLESEGGDINLTKVFSYDFSTGLLTSSVDEKGNQTDYEYDILGRSTKVVFPEVEGVRAEKRAEYKDTYYYVYDGFKSHVSEDAERTYTDCTHGFYAEGRSWVFIVDDHDLQYTSSSDGGLNWFDTVTIYDDAKSNFDLFYDGVYVHLVYVRASDLDLFYKRGDPNPDGSISWNNTKGVEGNDVGLPDIVVTENYVWVLYHKANDDFDLIVEKSDSLNGGWHSVSKDTIHSGYTYHTKQCKMTDLIDDHVYVVWQWYDSGHEVFSGRLYDGSWGATETIDDVLDEHGSYFDLSSWGNDVWAVWCDTDSYTKVKKRSYATGNWSTATNVFHYDYQVRLSRGEENGTLYLLWCDSSDVRYKHYDGSTWESSPHILCSESRIISGGSLSFSRSPDEGILSVVYSMSDHPLYGPYTVVHCNLFLNDESDNIDTSTTLYDENGNKIVKYYDGLGRLRKVERYSGSGLYSSENYRYNWQGLVESYTNPSGNEYGYEYDVLGQSTKIINPDKTYSQTVYNYTENTQEVIDEEGRKRKLSYDWKNRLTDVREYNTTSNYYLTLYEYDGVGNLINSTDSRGRNTYYYYDELNRPSHITYPDSTYEKMYYDDAGNLIQKRNRNDTYIVYHYDSLNRLINTSYYDEAPYFTPNWLSVWNYRKKINIDGSTAGSQTDYQIPLNIHYGSGADSPPDVYCDEHCQQDFDDIRFTSSDGTTLLDYWIESKNVSTAEVWVEVDSIPSEGTTIYVYYGNTAASGVSDADDTFVFFDDFEGESIGDVPDPDKWTLSDTNNDNDYVKIDYDPADGSNQVMHQHEGGMAYGEDNTRATTKEWADVGGVEVRYRFRKNKNHYYFAHYMYGRVFKASGVIIYQDACYYNPEGTLRYYDGASYNHYNPSLIVSNNVWYEFKYRLLSGSAEFLLDGEARSGEYRNPYGSPRRCMPLQYARKEDNRNAYIDDVRVRRYVYPEPSIASIGGEEEPGEEIVGPPLASEILGYDEVGNLVFSSWNYTRVTRSYDARNRLLSEDFNVSGQVYSLEYGYDNASNLVSMTYPDDGSLSIQYDALSRVSQLGSLAAFSYTLDDRVDTINYGNGVVTSYDYDSRSRPTDIVVEKGANTLLDLDYGYDDSGSVTSIYDGACNETYSYDLLDRLTGSTGPWGTVGYSYDSVGNRLTKTQGSTINYAYDCMDRLTSATGMGFDWDLDGDMVYMDDGNYEWNYTYDRRGGLVVVERDGSPFGRYWYDADGRRVMMQEGGDTLVHVYSGLDVVYEVNGSASTRHFYANGLHVAENRSGTLEYYHQDHLGSTRLKTDVSGEAVFIRNYEPFGSDYDGSGSEEFKYTGKREDTTGLYYYGARYYDPQVGRFITEDPVLGSLLDPQGLNRYVYCMNNPHKYVDPDGKLGFLASVLVSGLIGAIVSGGSYYLETGDISGSLVQGTIGGIAGMVGATTFMMGTLVTAGYAMTAVSGAVSGVAAGATGACLELSVYNAGLPSAADEMPIIEPEDVVIDISVGSVSAVGAKYIVEDTPEVVKKIVKSHDVLQGTLDDATNKVKQTSRSLTTYQRKSIRQVTKKIVKRGIATYMRPHMVERLRGLSVDW